MNAAHLSMALAWCALAALASGVTARAASPESARCYCMQRGGSVLETGDPFVHICSVVIPRSSAVWRWTSAAN